MAFVSCRREDPFARRVREVYRANLISAPRVGVELLTVVAQQGTHVEMRGTLEPLLVSSIEPLHLPATSEHEAGDLTGERSADLEVDVGVQLLGAFLTALAGGVPVPGIDLKGTVWKGASQLSFEARGVRERSVDLNLLGQALAGRRVNPEQPAARIFFDGSQTKLRLISRTLVSSQVAVRVHTAREHAVKVSTAGLTDMLGEASAAVGVSVESDGAVTFTGDPENAATFAMAHIPCNLSRDGVFSLGLSLGGESYLDTRDSHAEDLAVDHFPLVEGNGLLEIDAAQPGAP
jgi:hypothetical protein